MSPTVVAHDVRCYEVTGMIMVTCVLHHHPYTMFMVLPLTRPVTSTLTPSHPALVGRVRDAASLVRLMVVYAQG